MTCSVHLHRDNMLTVPFDCPITLSYYTFLLVLKTGLVITNHIQEFCYSFDKL